MQSALRCLAVGDSLTAGFHHHGLSFRPYALRLTELFAQQHIPIDVNEQGRSGEQVVPAMVQRLDTLLNGKDARRYDWVLILGGTNDLAFRKSAETIFNEGLQKMYDMVLQSNDQTTRLAVITVIDNGYYTREDPRDRQRQILNELIRQYARQSEQTKRICLIDFDEEISFHRVQNIDERQVLWDDQIHLTARGYDRMAEIIFAHISA